jgi:hypothetical protein
MWLTDSLPQETLTGGITFGNEAFLFNEEWDFHTGYAAIPHHETKAFYQQQLFPVNDTGLHHQASTSVQHSHVVLENANPMPAFRGGDLVYDGLQRPAGGQCDPSHKQDPEAMPISLTGFMEESPLMNKCRRQCRKQLKKKVATPSVLRASLSRRKEAGPAKYKCLMEGCGSDFTRKFNLNSGSSMAHIDCITHLAPRPPKVP